MRCPPNLSPLSPATGSGSSIQWGRSARCWLPLWGLAVLSWGMLVGCQPPQEEGVVVLVNGRPITQREFDYRWAELSEVSRARYEKVGGRRKFLDELITRELLMQEARKRGLDQSDRIREQAQRFKERLILDELIGERMKVKIEVSKEELEAYFAQHAHELLGPNKVEVALMLLPNIFAAKDLKKQIEAGGDFAKFAQRYSIDEKTKSKGGEAGPYRKGVLPPEVDEVIPTLKHGMISEPIKTDKGYYIVRINPLDRETIQADQATRERLRQELYGEKRRKRFEDIVAELRTSATIRLADASRYVTDDLGRHTSPATP